MPLIFHFSSPIMFKSSFLALLVLLLLASCRQSSQNLPQTAALSNAPDILAAYNEGKMSMHQGELHYASIKIEEAFGDLWVHGEDTDHTYVIHLQQEEPAGMEAFSIEQAEILYLKNTAVIKDLATQEKYLFKVSDVTLFAPIREMEFVQKLNGYGLAWYTLALGTEIGPAFFEARAGRARP
jgi:hypothetical protein